MGWGLFIGSLIGWVISLLWLAKGEPPFILSLSWFAITITALDVILTADVRVKQENGED